MIKTMQIQEQVKVPSAKKQLVGMTVGAKFKAPIIKRKYISSLISGDLKYQYPEQAWTTYIDPSSASMVIIERLK